MIPLIRLHLADGHGLMVKTIPSVANDVRSKGEDCAQPKVRRNSEQVRIILGISSRLHRRYGIGFVLHIEVAHHFQCLDGHPMHQ